jgi:hypothetical protein
MELLFDNNDDNDNGDNDMEIQYYSTNILHPQSVDSNGSYIVQSGDIINSSLNNVTNSLEISTSSVVQEIFGFLNRFHASKKNLPGTAATVTPSHPVSSIYTPAPLSKKISQLPYDVIINHILPYLYQPQSKELLYDIQNFHETKCFLIEKICNNNELLATKKILNVYSRTYIYSHANTHVLNRIDNWYMKNKRVLNMSENQEEKTLSIFKIYFIHYPNILHLFETPEKWIFLWALLPPFIRNRYLYLLYSLHAMENPIDE